MTDKHTANPTRRRYWDEDIEVIDRAELRALQGERLRWQLRRCFERSELFRERLGAIGAEPEDIGLEQLSAVAPITKAELRDDQARNRPYGSRLVAERAEVREVHPSTGTSGEPVNTAWTAADVEHVAEFTARTLWQFGVRPGHVIQNAFAYGLWVAGLSAHYGGARLGATVLPVGASLASDKQVAFLVDAASNVLLSTPSFALYLAERLHELEIDLEALNLSLGCFGGEPGAESAPTRRKLEQGLGIRAFDYYGLAEVAPTFASECELQCGIHFAEDHVLVESVDPDTHEPVPEGELGVLVFTNLTREATPALRYLSNDYARLTTKRCECGRTHVRAVGGIVGRHDDLVVFKGAKFYPGQVEKVIRSHPTFSDEFRVEVARADTSSPVAGCVVVVEHAPGAEQEASVAELRAALRAELGVRLDVRLEPFGSLERTTFKAKRLVEVEP